MVVKRSGTPAQGIILQKTVEISDLTSPYVSMGVSPHGVGSREMWVLETGIGMTAYGSARAVLYRRGEYFAVGEHPCARMSK